MFRWVVLGDNSWLGVDGANWYKVESESSGHYRIESNALKGDFISLFRLDTDLAEVRVQLKNRGPELEPYLDCLPGLRLMRPTSVRETLFCFLCTANNHLSRITQMIQKLGAYGDPLYEVADRKLTVMPSLETIAAIEEAELRAAGFGYRAATIPRVAHQILDRGGESWLDLLKTLSYEEAHRELVSLHSVGPKLADCIALYGLQHLDSAPIDTHLWQALVRLYFPEWQGKALTDAKYKEASTFLRGRFGELAGYAQQYLYYENLLNWRSRKDR